MLTDWPRSLTALVAVSTSSTVMPATKRLERRLPMEVFSAIARMDLLSDNQMKKARSKLTFVPQASGSGHVTEGRTEKLLNVLFGSGAGLAGHGVAAKGGADDLLRGGGFFQDFIDAVVDSILQGQEVSFRSNGEHECLREDEADNAAQGPAVALFGDARRDHGNVEVMLGDREQR